MWWSFRKSKAIAKGTRVTVSKSGASISRKIGKRASLSAGKRGARWSFRLFGFRFGGKL